MTIKEKKILVDEMIKENTDCSVKDFWECVEEIEMIENPGNKVKIMMAINKLIKNR